MKDSTWLYANKVVQYCRTGLPQHVEWMHSWLACLDELCTVVEEHFPYGLKWNDNGPKLPLPIAEIRPAQRSQQNWGTDVHDKTSAKPFRPKMDNENYAVESSYCFCWESGNVPSFEVKQSSGSC
ncbi:unnamed protein product [Heterobilharzia americana]|nr:unnamed protein product [Heterobilharzia americana]